MKFEIFMKFHIECCFCRLSIMKLTLIAPKHKYLYNPWEAPKEILNAANIELGKNYPKPIVDLKTSRQEALSAFSQLKVSQ